MVSSRDLTWATLNRADSKVSEAYAAHDRPGPASLRAQTKTSLAVIEKPTAADRLPDVTVADARMISEAKQKAASTSGSKAAKAVTGFALRRVFG
jgi:hypothetical protein